MRESGSHRFGRAHLSSWMTSSLIAITALFGVAGCATAPPADDEDAVAAYREANDPLEPLNRYFFEVNLGLDKLLLRPIAEIYRGALPRGVQDSVRNVVNNLDTPVTFIHDVLQGEEKRAGESFGRFATNTFIGVGGLFDVAAGDNENGEGGIPYHEEDLGQTFAVYGAGEGPYLMLPLLGPSNVRDLAGRVGDSFLDPVQYALSNEHRTGFSIARFAAGGIDTRARNIETLDDIERTSIDFYATVRSLYRQQRNAEIANGRPTTAPLPIMSSEFELDDDSMLDDKDRLSAVIK